MAYKFFVEQYGNEIIGQIGSKAASELIVNSLSKWRYYFARDGFGPMIVLKVARRGFPDWAEVKDIVVKKAKVKLNQLDFAEDDLFDSERETAVKSLEELAEEWEWVFQVAGRSDEYWGVVYDPAMLEIDEKSMRDKYKELFEKVKTDFAVEIKREDIKFRDEFIDKKIFDEIAVFDYINLVELSNEARKHFSKLENAVNTIVNDFEAADKWVELIIDGKMWDSSVTESKIVNIRENRSSIANPCWNCNGLSRSRGGTGDQHIHWGDKMRQKTILNMKEDASRDVPYFLDENAIRMMLDDINSALTHLNEFEEGNKHKISLKMARYLTDKFTAMARHWQWNTDVLEKKYSLSERASMRENTESLGVQSVKDKLAELVKEGGYTLSDNGHVITDKGKFEGEPVEILYFYDFIGNGFSTDTGYDGETVAWDSFEIAVEEKEAFELDSKIAWVIIWNSEQGFQHLQYLTDEKYQKVVEIYEKAADEDAENGDAI